jgi:hypothetical protein
MKHRSVIAYVIVVAALFAAQQLSHDLESFRSALGTRVNAGLMRTFLSLPSAEDATERVGEARPAETQLASCPKQRPAAKQRKIEPARAEARGAEVRGGESAMIEPPMLEPPHGSLREIAMIIPPGSGIDPHAMARAAADASATRVETEQTFRLVEQVRAGYVAARLEAKGGEWRKVEEALRNVEAPPAGSYEFRLDRDGSKTKVLKVKRVGAPPCCPPPARRAPRPAVVVDAAADAPLPVSAAAAHAMFVGE